MKWIYYKNSANSARYALGQYKDDKAKTLICVGINPSTAAPNALDPTLKRVSTIASAHGYANWIMLNIYPQRATNPNELHQHINDKLHIKNLYTITCILGKFTNADILFAYGNLISKRDFLQSCKSDIVNTIKKRHFKGKTFCLKLTAKGNPAHPLYMPTDSIFQKYPI